MQTIVAPLTVEDFEKDSILVISKVEIDSDGLGDFRELPNVKTYNISINEENRTAKFCSYGFGITCLNIDDRYNPLNLGSDYYGWLKQGRKIRLWAGIKEDETLHPYQLILGRVDDFKLNKRSGVDTCTISGRCLMRMVQDFKLYNSNTYWGTDILYNTVANKIRYNMEDDCEGIYKVELDYTNKDGTALEEIFENSDWTYDWHSVPNQLVFTPQRIPDFAGTNNLKVYYFQVQDVEDVVADILLAAGIFADEAAKNVWLTSEYCTVTDKTIKRVGFVPGTSASRAITLLAEVVQYRFYFDYAGNPIFRPKPDIESPVNLISDYEDKTKNIEENVEEVYTHIIVIGEERDRVLGDDEIAPATPTDLTLSTGLGEVTQASLAWIKAEWDANTESDFGHYELRIRKIGDSDYTEVSTTAITFIWYSLEPGVEYVVIIRAVDIYNNRSDWSEIETILTATDETEPDQITGSVATPGLAGIRLTWEGATEGDIAGYMIERQESDNGTTWTGEWIERDRINATMYLDLHLPYAKYYRYRISAYTHAGVFGPTSTPTADSIKANQAGHDDIVAKCITADLIWGNKLSVIFADMGEINAGNITLDCETGFIRSIDKTYGGATAGFWMGYNVGKWKFHIGTNTEYLKWDGDVLNIKGSITLINTIPHSQVDGLGDLALEDSVAYGDITGVKPPSNADVTLTAIQGELSLGGGGLVLASGGAKIRGGQTSYGVGTGFWLGDVYGVSKFSIGSSANYLKWTGSALEIKGNIALIKGNVTLDANGYVKTYGKDSYTDTTAGFWLGYSAGYKLNIGSSSQYLKWSGSALSIKGSITIIGGSGIANLADAGYLATLDSVEYAAITGAKPPSNADYFGGIAGSLAYYNMVSEAMLDSTIIIGGFIKTNLLTANNIRTGTLDTVRLNVGWGTNNDIYFKQSGIRLYDAGSNNLFFTGPNSTLTFNFGSNYVLVKSTVDRLYLGNVSRTLIFYSAGTLQLPALYSAPAGHNGDIAYNSASGWFAFYAGGQWKHVKYWTTTW